MTSIENITQAKLRHTTFLIMNRTLVVEMFFIDQEITSYNMYIILPYKLKTSKIVYILSLPHFINGMNVLPDHCDPLLRFGIILFSRDANPAIPVPPSH